MAANEYCSIVLSHIKTSDRICDGESSILTEEDGYMLPSSIVDIYGDHPMYPESADEF